MQKKDGGPALKPADQPKQQLQWSQWYVYLKPTLNVNRPPHARERRILKQPHVSTRHSRMATSPLQLPPVYNPLPPLPNLGVFISF